MSFVDCIENLNMSTDFADVPAAELPEVLDMAGRLKQTLQGGCDPRLSVAGFGIPATKEGYDSRRVTVLFGPSDFKNDSSWLIARTAPL